MSEQASAIGMARGAGVDPKAFRAALRAAKLPWHLHGARWIVTTGTAEHDDMKRVLAALPRLQER